MSDEGSVRVERLVRRERDAKLVMLRTLAEYHRWWGKQVEDWRYVCSSTGADTEDAELDCQAVQSETERLIEQLRIEIEALKDA